MKSNQNQNQINLGTLSVPELGMLQFQYPKAQCYFFTEDRNNRVLLELRADFITLTNPLNGIVISGLRCDYQHAFQVLRAPSPSPTMMLGAPQSLRIKIGHENEGYNVLTLHAEDAKQLDQFGKKLEKKYIVQHGFHENFKAVKILGKGLTATVYKANSFRDQKNVAIKSFKRTMYFDTANGKQSFQKEFKILSLVDHPNVCAFEGVYESPNTTYIVMENLALSLFGWIHKFGFPQACETKKIIYQLLSGIDYLHEKDIMHRDLKLENIMVRADSKQKPEIVIVDLGLAEYTYSDKFLYSRCGTPGYVAPQVLNFKGDKKNYTQACDIFSLGVIFHILSFKKSLFESSEIKDVIRKNGECAIDFSQEYFKTLPEQGMDLLKTMLQKDPLLRITATQALQHQYLRSINVSEFPCKIQNTLSSIQNIQVS